MIEEKELVTFEAYRYEVMQKEERATGKRRKATNATILQNTPKDTSIRTCTKNKHTNICIHTRACPFTSEKREIDGSEIWVYLMLH